MSTIQIEVGKYADNQAVTQAIHRAVMLILQDAEAEDRARNMVYGRRGFSADACRETQEKVAARRAQFLKDFGHLNGFQE